MQLPRELQQKFERIDPHKGAGERGKFLLLSLVPRQKQKLEDRDEPAIDLVSQGIAGLLGEMVAILEPYLVYSDGMLNDRKRPVFHEYEDITSVENLLAAWREFVAGKRKKGDVQEFSAKLVDNVMGLRADLAAGTYRHGGYEAFKIADPKPRDIHKATVRDRLVHHAVYRQLYPFFDRTWISDSFSCRRQKGTHRAMARFKDFARKVSQNDTRTCWVLKCDIRKFFASIDQEILLSIIEARLNDGAAVALLREIIGSFSVTPRIGLPLGNLTSQMLVNVYMNEFDQFVKHGLKERFYIRYADDFVILCADRAHLEKILSTIGDFLMHRLRLSLHPNKVSIGTLASGIDFLGWVHFPDHDVLRTTTKRRMLRHPDLQKPAVIDSYKALLQHGNAKKLLAALDSL